MCRCISLPLFIVVVCSSKLLLFYIFVVAFYSVSKNAIVCVQGLCLSFIWFSMVILGGRGDFLIEIVVVCCYCYFYGFLFFGNVDS